MKKLLLLLVFCPLLTFGQVGQFPYQLLRQMYRGDTVSTKLNGDSVNYYTDLGSFRFNKDIYVKGIKLGGSGSEVAKYLKNFSPNDTVISFVAKSGTTGMQIQSTLANQCIRLNNSFTYGTGILSYVTGLEGVAGRFDATGSTANTAYGVRINSKIATPFRVDSLNTEKFSINSSGVPKINRYSGTGNRQIVVNSSGELVLGAPNSLIATQLKNYNENQDTVIRFPDLGIGKYGIWQNTNNGVHDYVVTNNGSQVLCNTNNNIFLNIVNNNINGIGVKIAFNKGQGILITETNKTGIGIKSFAADSVSLTSGALTGTFGKTASHLDIDGFGHTKLIQSTAPTITLGTGAGTGATYTLISGSTDKAGVISVTTGISPNATGEIFTITYANAYKGMAVFMAVPGNNEASSVQGATRPHMTGYDKASSGLTASGTALNANTTYVWHYCVMQ